jgi:hypothetical protein
VTLRGAGKAWTQQARVSVDVRGENGIRTIQLAPGLGDTRGRDVSTGGVGGTYELERMLRARPNSALRVGVDVERQHLDTGYRNVRDGEAVGDVVARAVGSRFRSGAFASTSWMPAARVRLFGAVRWDRIADSAFGRVGGDSVMQAWSSPWWHRPAAAVVAGDLNIRTGLARLQSTHTRSDVRSATVS